MINLNLSRLVKHMNSWSSNKKKLFITIDADNLDIR